MLSALYLKREIEENPQAEWDGIHRQNLHIQARHTDTASSNEQYQCEGETPLGRVSCLWNGKGLSRVQLALERQLLQIFL
jgi:hypothetical protein